ncbi:DUF222 domain-containing protein [Mycobacterium tuberculosis]
MDTTPDAGRHRPRHPQPSPTQPRRAVGRRLRALIASGKLGQHNGLPVSIVVTTTLTDLQTGAGRSHPAAAPCYPWPM